MCTISWSLDNICPVWRVRRPQVHLPHTWWGEGALDKQWWEWRLAVNKLSDSITIPISGWLTPGQQSVTHRMMISWPLLSRSQSQDTHSSQTKVMTKDFSKENLQMNSIRYSHLFILMIICCYDSLISLQRNSTLKVMTLNLLKHPITYFPLTINDHFKCFFPLHKSMLSLEVTNSLCLCCPLLTGTFSQVCRNKSVWRETQVWHALI